VKQAVRHLLPEALTTRPEHTFDLSTGQRLNGSRSNLNRQVVESGMMAEK
jgi:hypothetical protein